MTIIRDDWGIAHVYGKTDADAVFGMEYAQAEDDFNRIETNYLNSLGRLAEAEGESALFTDLRQRLFIDPDSLRAEYRSSPPWLKRLMDAFADGLNYFLYKHPDVKPRVFEPWMALSFTEGSIGGDIESINVRDLAAFYGDSAGAARTSGDADELDFDPSGSNGIAIAPRLAANHHALLWINPHTSFYFRSELQMASEEGLNTYGAVTWGQFFIYQGFNATAGWMHTSSGVDNIDEFLERSPGRPRTVTVPFNAGTGTARKTFTVYYTRHGPVVRKQGDRFVSVIRAPKRRTSMRSGKSWSCIPTLRTTPSSQMDPATSRTSTRTTFRAATPLSTGHIPSTATIRPRPTTASCHLTRHPTS